MPPFEESAIIIEKILFIILGSPSIAANYKAFSILFTSSIKRILLAIFCSISMKKLAKIGFLKDWANLASLVKSIFGLILSGRFLATIESVSTVLPVNRLSLYSLLILSGL